MIKLDASSQTTYSASRGGQTLTNTVDTLVVRYVEMNLVEGSILAIIDRGTVVNVPAVISEGTPEIPAVLDGDGNVVTPAVPATDPIVLVPATTAFVSGDTSLWVDVHPDGSFSSRDGAWKGTVSAAPQITAGLKAAFDGFLLASGAVTGTIV